MTKNERELIRKAEAVMVLLERAWTANPGTAAAQRAHDKLDKARSEWDALCVRLIPTDTLIDNGNLFGSEDA